MIYKRGRIYWYKFVWHGETIRESTKQGNDRVARQREAAHRTTLGKVEVAIREKKPVPTLSEFCDKRFKPWAKASFEKSTPANWYWYRAGIRALLSYKPLANAKLDTIGNELAADFGAHRQAEGKQISTINSALRVLRRILRLSSGECERLTRCFRFFLANAIAKPSLRPSKSKLIYNTARSL
jgi:thymidylate synthase